MGPTPFATVLRVVVHGMVQVRVFQISGPSTFRGLHRLGVYVLLACPALFQLPPPSLRCDPDQIYNVAGSQWQQQGV
jgi:hypothetical protein